MIEHRSPYSPRPYLPPDVPPIEPADADPPASVVAVLTAFAAGMVVCVIALFLLR